MYGVYRGKPVRDMTTSIDFKEDTFVQGYLNYQGEQPYILGTLVGEVDAYCTPEFWVAVKKETLCAKVWELNGKDVFVGDVIADSYSLYLVGMEEGYIFIRDLEFSGVAYPIRHAKGIVVGNEFDNKALVERWV